MRLLAAFAVLVAFGGLSSFVGGCKNVEEPSKETMQHKGHAMPAEKAQGEAQIASPADESEMKSQEICPVMGGKINKEVYADHDGKRVYFCCPGCIETFKSDPEKYLKILKDQGVEPAKTP